MSYCLREWKNHLPNNFPHQNGSFQWLCLSLPSEQQQGRFANWSMMQFVTSFRSAVTVLYHQLRAIRTRGHECLQLTDEKWHLCKCKIGPIHLNPTLPSPARILSQTSWIWGMGWTSPKINKCNPGALTEQMDGSVWLDFRRGGGDKSLPVLSSAKMMWLHGRKELWQHKIIWKGNDTWCFSQTSFKRRRILKVFLHLWLTWGCICIYMKLFVSLHNMLAEK